MIIDNKSFNSRNLTIKNVAFPVAARDAANKSYVDQKTPVQTENQWLFRHKQLGQLADPENQGDALTLSYFLQHGMYKNEHKFDARHCTVTNLPEPIGPTDVVNKKCLKDAVAGLGYALYKELLKSRGLTLPEEADWKGKVLESTWDELIKWPSTE